MTMGHGMGEAAVQFFDKKWGCKTIKMDNQHTFQFKQGSFVLTEMYGDCTAATLYTQGSDSDWYLKNLPVIIEFLSLNGRISCLFTFRTFHKDVQKTKEALSKYPIKGLHIQRSNRDNKGFFQVTGILKVPSPYVKHQYRRHGEDCALIDHKHDDWTVVEADNKLYGFST